MAELTPASGKWQLGPRHGRVVMPSVAPDRPEEILDLVVPVQAAWRASV